MHFIEDLSNGIMGVLVRFLHTSKRMHFIEDGGWMMIDDANPYLHTSKRMHFIEERCHVRRERCGTLAYVKTYALH